MFQYPTDAAPVSLESIPTSTPEDWPREGAISMRNALLSNTLRRRVSFQAMTLDVPAGENICITGELGSEKSSLVAALL